MRSVDGFRLLNYLLSKLAPWPSQIRGDNIPKYAYVYDTIKTYIVLLELNRFYGHYKYAKYYIVCAWNIFNTWPNSLFHGGKRMYQYLLCCFGTYMIILDMYMYLSIYCNRVVILIDVTLLWGSNSGYTYRFRSSYYQ